MAGEKVWQATVARAQLETVLAAALAGKPQVIRERSGQEVVVLSRAAYERMKPTVKEFLPQSAGAAGDDDDAALEAALRQLRATGAMGLAPRLPDKD